MFFISKVLKRYSIFDIFESVISYIIGYPVLLLSYFVPRNKKKWVLGNKVGFLDNTKYMFFFLLENTNDDVYWVTSDKKIYEELRKRELPVCYKYSLKGFWHLITAYYYVCTVTTRYICYWTSGGAYKINLWHGVGIKAIGEGSASLKDYSLISRILIPYGYEKYNLFLSTSKMMNAHFTKSFHLDPSSVYEGIYPRCSFLLSDKSRVESFVDKYEGEKCKQIINFTKKFERVYIYMPTWRLQYGSDFLKYAIPGLERLNETLKLSNSLMLLKLHPSMKYSVEDMDSLSHIIYVTPELDVYPLLPFTDVLITDYSSIYYDYLLMDNKGCILYDFDYAQYVKREFSFICDYHEYTPGIHVDEFERLLSIIREKTDCSVEKRDWIVETFWGDYFHKSDKALYDRITNK